MAPRPDSCAGKPITKGRRLSGGFLRSNHELTRMNTNSRPSKNSLLSLRPRQRGGFPQQVGEAFPPPQVWGGVFSRAANGESADPNLQRPRAPSRDLTVATTPTRYKQGCPRLSPALEPRQLGRCPAEFRRA